MAIVHDLFHLGKRTPCHLIAVSKMRRLKPLNHRFVRSSRNTSTLTWEAPSKPTSLIGSGSHVYTTNHHNYQYLLSIIYASTLPLVSKFQEVTAPLSSTSLSLAASIAISKISLNKFHLEDHAVQPFDLNRAEAGSAVQSWIVGVLTSVQIPEEMAESVARRWTGSGKDLVQADIGILRDVLEEEYCAAVVKQAKGEFVEG
jgi:hypothetical protein